MAAGSRRAMVIRSRFSAAARTLCCSRTWSDIRPPGGTALRIPAFYPVRCEAASDRLILATLAGMEPAPPGCMANYHSRWVVLVLLLMAVAVAGTYALRETNRDEARPARNAMINGLPSAGEHDAVGTSGTDHGTPGQAENSGSVIRELETITGLVDRRPLIGRKVDLHVPVASSANDQAFWIGEKDNRVLVVPRRDHRDSVKRQAGLVADNGIARLEAGTTAAITGSIQKLPIAEEMYSWGLTSEERSELGGDGVYLRADTITVQ